MKIAIIYASKHGTTEKVARSIEERLSDKNKVELFPSRKNSCPDLRGFEMVIFGSSIYMGQADKSMKALCLKNESALLKKKIGLYVCGMHIDKELQNKELTDAYPESLRKEAKAMAFLGGEFLFDRMNFFERFIAKKIAKTNQSVHRIDWEGIDRFIAKITY